MILTAETGLKKNRMDWALFLCVLILLAVGTLAVFSSVAVLPSQARIIRVQLMAIPLGLLVFGAAWSLNYQVYQDQWRFVYGVLLAALVAVLVFGVVDKGARSWFRLPFFSIQPSEFARVGLILVLANFLDKRIGKIRELQTVLGAFALCVPVFFLLIKQPDFSAILITFPVALIMLFASGASLFHLSIILGYAFISALFPILWTVISLNPELLDNALVGYFFHLSDSWLSAGSFVAAVAFGAWLLWRLSVQLYANVSGIYCAGAALVLVLGFFSGMLVKTQMKEYQQKRLEVFLSPESDPRGAGYNLLQARIAIGSGGILGRGIFSGTQSRLGFVPERHTDFILAVVGEELGFWGMLLVTGLYVLMMRRIMQGARMARDRFGYLVNCGIFAMFLVYFCVNFGMLLGLAPVAGVPLPLVSYGGSNLVATMAALGIAESVYARRYALT
ncbi:MAG: rod shape-determining protein RodA [Elusimicrobia bacterium GWA2_61_42]|nr:MAG: rod shape-determining protein RodA [Elusimicrobia bacterium GWA2_61_42]OGR78685.1 MAG: rod shape-determining protein RodA [Elusimicrobia bacterium GWC2_61_25]